MIGWTPPAVPPPPKHAIDWDRHDPETGKAFSITDWPVPGAVVEPPAGSGRRGQWSDADRDAFALPLRGVLRRHGLADHPSVRELLPDPQAEPEPADVEGFSLASLPPPPVAPAATAPTAPAATAVPAASHVRLVVEVRPDGWPDGEELLAALGHPGVVVAVERVREERFRGSAHRRLVVAHELQVVVAAAEAEAVAEGLRALGVVPATTAADDEDLAAHEAQLAASAATAEREALEEAALAVAGRTLTTISVVVDPRRAPLVDEAIEELALRFVRRSMTTRTVVTTFRGSRSEAEAPAVRIELWVEPADTYAVATRVGQAAGLAAGDEALVVTPPTG